MRKEAMGLGLNLFRTHPEVPKIPFLTDGTHFRRLDRVIAGMTEKHLTVIVKNEGNAAALANSHITADKTAHVRGKSPSIEEEHDLLTAVDGFSHGPLELLRENAGDPPAELPPHIDDLDPREGLFTDPGRQGEKPCPLLQRRGIGFE